MGAEDSDPGRQSSWEIYAYCRFEPDCSLPTAEQGYRGKRGAEIKKINVERKEKKAIAMVKFRCHQSKPAEIRGGGVINFLVSGQDKAETVEHPEVVEGTSR